MIYFVFFTYGKSAFVKFVRKHFILHMYHPLTRNTQPLALYIKSQTPKKYHDRIIPTHRKTQVSAIVYTYAERCLASGCKRFVVDTGYLKALNKDNFDVNYDGIKEITETGIVTKTGTS